MEESSKKRGRPLRWFLIGAVTLGVLALAAWFVVFRVNRFSLELVLTGEPSILLEYGDSFTEPGVTPVLRGTLFLKEGHTLENLEILRETDLNEGKLARTYTYDAEELAVIAQSDLLTLKKTTYVANLSEDEVNDPESNHHYLAVKALAEKEGSQVLPICAKLEADIAELDDPEEKAMFMEEL